ncbi:hypothetical protein [Aquihabitans sp. McL0605]|uniref:hypothetical protein n=1 Tax=Aquihabitans sp. McL0605 TaxID=3415671 RepID=UPI003CEE4C4A
MPLLLVAVLSVAGLAACSHDDGPKVLVIGDSLTFGCQLQGLGKHGPGTWTIDAVIGRRTEAGILAATEHHPEGFDQVIIALGTNDYYLSEQAFSGRIDKMMEVIGPDVPVTWVNVDTGTTHLAPATEGVNPALAAAPGRHPSLKVADWDAFINARADVDSLRAGDGIHYNTDGYDVRTQWMESLVPT